MDSIRIGSMLLFLFLVSGAANAWEILPAGLVEVGHGGAKVSKVDCVKVKPAQAGHALTTWNGAVIGPNKGGIYDAKLCTVKAGKTVSLYRVYSNSKGDRARKGQWWDPIAPAGTKASYRTHNAICTDWNPDLDKLVTCTLHAGAVFAIGPGESVGPFTVAEHGQQVQKHTCANAHETYGKEADHLQVFVAAPWGAPNDALLTCAGDRAHDPAPALH